MVEEDLVPMAAELMAKAKAQGVNFYLPTDVVIADKVITVLVHEISIYRER